MVEWINYTFKYNNYAADNVASGRLLSNKVVKSTYAIFINGVTNNVGTTSSSYMFVNNGGRAIGSQIRGGGIKVSAGATTSNTVVNGPRDNNGRDVAEWVNGGTASNTSVLQGSQMIKDGGRAYGTLLTGAGVQTMSGNAYAYNTMVNGVNAVQDIKENTYAFNTLVYNGSQYLSGGVATSTTVYAGGTQTLTKYAHADFTTITGGKAYVYDKASVAQTNVNGGTLTLNGGNGYNTTIANGIEYITGGSVDEGAIINQAGFQTVLTGGLANKATVNNNGIQMISNGGQASLTTVNANGEQQVFTGGVGFNTTVNGGRLYNLGGNTSNALITNGGNQIISTGTDYNATINARGLQTVFGNAVNTIINATGSQYISQGGTASNITINNQGIQDVYNGGRVITTVVNNNGNQHVYAGGAIYNTTLNGGTLHDRGGNTYNTIINSAGRQYISTGSIDTNATINNYGSQMVLAGGIARNANINLNGNQTLSGGAGGVASATGTIIQAGGQQNLNYWGISEQVTLSGGTINVSAGGSINGNANFAAGGIINVYSGAGVSTAISNGGKEYIYNGGWATNTVVNNAAQIVSTGGTVNNTNVLNNGTVDITTGGIANNITVSNAGILRISGGTVNTATINQNGYTTVNGGTLSNYVINNGGIVNANNGTLNNTSVTSGGSLIYAGNTTTLTGNLNIDVGGYLNGRVALQKISINLNVKENLIALFNDPTMFAATKSAPTIKTDADKTTIAPIDANKNSGNNTNLNDLLNNPNYFSPVTVSPQAAMLQTRAFIAPESNTLYETPTTYADGDTLNIGKAADGSTVFTPPGHDPISGVRSAVGLVGNSVSFLPQTAAGSTLVYGNGSTPTSAFMTYNNPVYIAENATVNLNTANNLSSVYVYDTATLNATKGTVGNLYVDNGGVANISDPSKLTGTLSLESGGKTNITTSTGGTISLTGTENKGLAISGKANPNSNVTIASKIENFDGNDSITLSDIKATDVKGVAFVDKDNVTITLADGSSVTLNIIGIQDTGYSLSANSNGSLIFETCFLAGTSISTLDGSMVIENIKVGDVVEAFDWKSNKTISASVSWVGHKHMSVKTHLSDDLAGYPVRVLKNAISENVPNKDLLITPEHCLFFEGNFVPARMLVNGRSIYYDRSITSYTYYHIETEQHSVIWANGMLTESYLDTGNRNVFSNGQKVVSLFSDAKSWDIDAAAPLNVNREIVEPIYNKINERALEANATLQSQAMPLTTDPNLCLETELGTIIQPHACNNGKYVFNIPEGVNAVHLISRTHRPCETVGSFIDDRRELGVLVGSVFIINKNGIYEVTDHLSNAELDGWDVVEQSPCRWTNGKATMNIHNNYSENRTLMINILAGGPYIKEEKITVENSKKAS